MTLSRQHDLDHGAFDIIGRRRMWYIVLAVVLGICLGSILLRGFTFGAGLTGGVHVHLPAAGAQGQISIDQVDQVFTDSVGRPPASVQLVGEGETGTIVLRADTLGTREMSALTNALFERLQPLGTDGAPSPQLISASVVSATWGDTVTQRLLIALAVVLVGATAFLALYFGPRTALVSLVAVSSSVLVTAGFYALVGFTVTAGAVVGLLAILIFSLYNTVVVFDKVRENTHGLLSANRRTFAEAANLAVNQTLTRSVTVSVLALLPVLGLLIAGGGLLGAGGVPELAAVLLVGIVASVLSSTFLAVPLLVGITLRDPAYRQQAERVAQRRNRLTDKAGAAGAEHRAAAGTRREESLAAAAGVPTRVGKSKPAGRSRGGRRTGRGSRSAGRTGRRSGPGQR